jgi:hypothetical protein
MFCVKNSYSRSKYLKGDPLLKTNMFNDVPIKKMSFVSNGRKFKLYTVPNGLLFI